MPKQKDLKRVVRKRMQKTGESYTAARSHIIRRKAAPPPPDYSALSGVKDEVIEKRTGHTWAQWVAILDEFGAARRPHREIAEHVFSLGTPGWWSQTVAVGYERIRGLRGIGQRMSGSWEASKSRTFDVPAEQLFEAITNSRKRSRWFSGPKITIRKSTPPKTIRAGFEDGTLVQFYFTPKSRSKTQLAIQHTKLPSKEELERMKTFWGEQLEALAKVLGP
jgi:uncharacterized protein YndB with AHSA1/START domain